MKYRIVVGDDDYNDEFFTNSEDSAIELVLLITHNNTMNRLFTIEAMRQTVSNGGKLNIELGDGVCCSAEKVKDNE